MFKLALEAKIPILGVTTDDLPNFVAALTILSGRKVVPWPTSKTGQSALGPYLYWVYDMKEVTLEVYTKLVETENQLVVINPDKPSSLIFEVGILPTPESMVKDYLLNFMEQEGADELYPLLKGLSLKAVSEVVQLTMARTGGLNPKELRRTRTMLGGVVQGLYNVDTAIDFYQRPSEIQDWINLNDKYFLNPKTPPKLMPRGLMLAGSAGVGKSMAAKDIANHFGVPLFRLDISTTLNKFIGESEARVARSLAMVEKESPCVLLLDEVEKIFNGNDDQGVTQRILSQLLWWLADHTSKVLTVMTTNKLATIPPELYRAGRIDRVVEIIKLYGNDIMLFAVKVFKHTVGEQPTNTQYMELTEALNHGVPMAHSEVAEKVYELIKKNSWVKF